MISKIPTHKPLNNQLAGKASSRFTSNAAILSAIYDNREISTFSVSFFLLSFLLVFSGCSNDKTEPSPQIHQKKYTLDELESKYRNIPKRPAEFDRDTNSISSQEKKFYSGLSDTFTEIEHYQKDISVADKIASKREEKEDTQRLVLETRKKEVDKANVSPEQQTGSIINAYYN